ncbi:hypothetical protein CPR19079_NPKGKJFF_01087 [Companilactobacillus paralimentarius]
MVNGAMLYGATVDDSHSSTADGTSTSDSIGSSSTSAATSTGNARGTISTMEDGGAPVYSSPVGNNFTGQKLPNGSKWAIDKQVSINGVVWYRVATNEWVSEKYSHLIKLAMSSQNNKLSSKSGVKVLLRLLT